MTVARFPGESIAGEKISYSFGSVVSNRKKGRFRINFGYNGRAYVIQKWVVRSPDDPPPPPDTGFDVLDAYSARGESDDFKDTGKASVGAHREITGVISGDARVTVSIPRANVAHLTPPKK